MAYIYVIRQHGSNAFKIGISSSPKDRLKTLQTASPARLELLHVSSVQDDLAISAERFIHEKLSFLRLNGEWFCIPGPDFGVDFLRRLKEEVIPSAIEAKTVESQPVTDPHHQEQPINIFKTKEQIAVDAYIQKASASIASMSDREKQYEVYLCRFLQQIASSDGCKIPLSGLGATSFMASICRAGFIPDRQAKTWTPLIKAIESRGLVRIDRESESLTLGKVFLSLESSESSEALSQISEGIYPSSIAQSLIQ
jgi:hypothetical protein